MLEIVEGRKAVLGMWCGTSHCNQWELCGVVVLFRKFRVGTAVRPVYRPTRYLKKHLTDFYEIWNAGAQWPHK